MIPWPELQKYQDYSWYESECIEANDGMWAAIPLKRLEEVEDIKYDLGFK